MGMDAGTMGGLLTLAGIFGLLISWITWRVAQHKIDSPRLLAGCSLALGLFPPLNLLLLSLLALLPDRNPI
ncbi:MAG: hypothetical protein WBN65_16395, partial [Gammaproteobacteria bacterium]